MDKIFISIASYRDPELLPTLRDCIAKAKHPERLVFAICWQRDEKESLEEFAKDKRFKVLDVPFKDSKGACWARHSIQTLYRGEKYSLQLDSHHRFAENWDVICINTIQRLISEGVKKPLLTAYLPSYNPTNDPAERVNHPWKMNFDRFIPEGAVFFLPASIDNHEQYEGRPIPARFFSAHFVFTLGSWIKEVPYDPYYYFHGEEISLAVRSYTHGYDLYHPTTLIAWHEYTRRGRTKQWDDDKDWVKRNNDCHLRNRKLFEMDGEKRDVDFGVYGFGKQRTLREYEEYAGVCFKMRGIQQYTKDNFIAPNPRVKDFEASLLCVFKHCIDISYSQVPENDYDFWCVAFKDKEDREIYRKDALPEEIERMMKDPDKYCKVWREFNYAGKPHKWVVWPHSKSKGWCEQISGTL